MKRALICGASGQDGSILAKFLLQKNYEVWGTSRDAELNNYYNFRKLNIFGRVKMLSMVPSDYKSVLAALTDSWPDEIYFLAGQSSVGLSFKQSAETIESIVSGVLNILEAVRFLEIDTRIYNASSSECFGSLPEGTVATEHTPLRPCSPYGVAKAASQQLVSLYREAYGLHCSNGILFNHESTLRPSRYVTKKIVTTACEIACGTEQRLRLGRLDIARDWGWAPDYVCAMWRMLQEENSGDFVIATGATHTLSDFVEQTFRNLNMDWRDYVDIDEALFRPLDIDRSAADPKKANEVLNWRATTGFSEMIELLIEAELHNLKRNKN